MNVCPTTFNDFINGKVFIVAEIGKNFIQTEEERTTAEYLDNAKVLVKAAKEAGAQAVKFQTHCLDDEIMPIAFDSPHFIGVKRYDWVKRNEVATPLDTFWAPLKAYCDEIGIIFFSTPMSRGAARQLESLQLPFFKVASSDILDFVLLEYLAQTRKPIIIPTGMSSIEEVDSCVQFLQSRDVSFVLLHAISKYPYSKEESNLETLLFLKKRYPNIIVGFSQNSPWIEPAIAAVALGARIIEQHFTSDRSLFGPDHKVSMLAHEFSQMVQGIERVLHDSEFRTSVLAEAQPYMGKYGKVINQAEYGFRPLFRKSLVAAETIPVGVVITSEMLKALRPYGLIGGLPSEAFIHVCGRLAPRTYQKNDPIGYDIFLS